MGPVLGHGAAAEPECEKRAGCSSSLADALYDVLGQPARVSNGGPAAIRNGDFFCRAISLILSRAAPVASDRVQFTTH